MAAATGPSPHPEALPEGARVVGGTLALLAAVLALLRVPGLLARDLVWGAATAAAVLALLGGFGLLVAVAPKAAGRLFAWAGVPRTRGGAIGLGLVLGIGTILLGVLALATAVAGVELLARGASLESLFQTPTFALIAVNLAVNVALFFLASLGYLHFARGLDLRAALENLGFQGGVREAAEGVAWSIGALVLLGVIGLALLHFGETSAERNVLAELITQTLTLPQALVVSLLAALGEEVFFRGLLQPRIGLVPQALLFSLAHATYLNTFEIVGTLVLGLAFGVALHRTDSLYAPIAGHVTVNMLAFVAARYAPAA